MWRAALSNLVAHKRRLLTTGLAIALGVAFLTGTLVFNQTIGRTMDQMFAGAYAKTDALVRAEGTFEMNGYEQRDRIPEAMVGRLAQLPGVADVQGDVWGFAQVVGKDGDPIGTPGMGPPTVGANWSDTALNTFTLEEGRGPKSDDEVVLDKGVADRGGYQVGDRATVLVSGAPLEVTVTGIATFNGADSPGGASFTMFTFDAAQRYIGEPGRVDSVSLSAMPGVSEEELVAQAEAVLDPGMEAITGDAYTKENQDAMATALGFFNTFMLVFAVIALLVGGFIIFNTFYITVAQRTRQHALMRAVGASKRQVLRSILAEALLIGLLASLVGLAGGVAVTAGLKALLAAFDIDMPAGGIGLTAGTALLAVGAGLLVTVAAALAPARRAGRVPPIAALRDVETGASGPGSPLRIGAGILVLGTGVSLLLYGLWGATDGMPLVGGGAVLVFFGVAMLARAVSRPLSGVIGLPLPALRGMSGVLARQNAMRNPQRTAATASALMIGVGLVAFITIFAASAKSSFSDVVDRTFLGDVIVTAPGQMAGGGLSPELKEDLAALPAVDTVGAIRGTAVQIEGSVVPIIAVDDAMFDVFDIGVLEGSRERLSATAIAVWDEKAADAGVALGDTVEVVFPQTGPKTMTVAMVYDEQAPAGDWFLPLAAFEANLPPASQVDAQLFVKAAEGTSPEALLAAVDAAAEAYPGANVLDQSGYKEEQLAMVDQMLGLVYALLGLAVFIALLGIANTLALSIIERTRELGLLRAVGMTRRQLRSTIRWEAVMIAVQGTVLGLAIGLFFGWALVTAMADEGLTTLAVPVAQLAVVVLIAAVAGVLAAVLPARRAAKMDVLRAIIAE
ncbi:MAG: ABC transporter permease [Actinomycetota bacterium]